MSVNEGFYMLSTGRLQKVEYQYSACEVETHQGHCLACIHQATPRHLPVTMTVFTSMADANKL